MKKILYLTLPFVFFLLACDMEELPKSQISSKPVFNTETGLEMYTNSFYEAFPRSTTQYSMSHYIAVNYVVKYLTENGFSPEESSGWNWGTLRNINYFIANCSTSSAPAAARSNYIGVAKFFRAYFYFEMMKKFGDLPWINRPLDVKDPLLTAKRDPRTLIVDSIKSDLDYAIKNIRVSKDATCSTITKSVAAALKSRVCLWEGTFRKYRTQAGLQASANDWLQEAVKASEIVMSSGYSLYNGAGPKNSYRQLFLSKVPIANEVLYAVTFNNSLGVVHSSNRQWTSVTFGAAASLTRPFVNTYLMLDGTPFTNQAGYETMPFTDECVNRDYRLSQTIRTPGFTRISGGSTVQTAADYAYTLTGYHTSKFTLDDMQFDNVDICDNNVIVFRYAETLLNYAEAKAELGTMTDADWKLTIGALRARAGITGGLDQKPTVADNYLKTRFYNNISDPTLLEVRRERCTELSFEGFCWSDICRWNAGELLTKDWEGIYIPEFEKPYDMNGDGKLDVCFTKQLKPADKVPGVYYLYVGKTLANGSNNNSQIAADGHTLVFMKDQKRTWNDKLYFFPIPANDLVMNPNLGQNPGWGK